MSTKAHRRTSTPAGAARRGQGRTSSCSTELQRRIQRQVARSDRQHPAKEFDGSMQADARAYPEPPLPAQHKAKPGHESQIDPPPRYDAPYYQGSGKLHDVGNAAPSRQGLALNSRPVGGVLDRPQKR